MKPQSIRSAVGTRVRCALSIAALSLAGVGLTALAQESPQPTIPNEIDTADVAAEAEAMIADLGERVASQDEFNKSKKLVPQQAKILGVLAQAVALGDEEVAWKGRALEIRDAAMQLASAADYPAAQEAGKQIAQLLNGESQKMAKPIPWHDITELEDVMKEVTKRNTLARRPILRKPRFEQGKEEGARTAEVLAVLLTVARDDTHEVEKKEDLPEWQKFAEQARSDVLELARIFKEGEQPEARTQFITLSKSCKQCHDKFRPDATF